MQRLMIIIFIGPFVVAIILFVLIVAQWHIFYYQEAELERVCQIYTERHSTRSDLAFATQADKYEGGTQAAQVEAANSST